MDTTKSTAEKRPDSSGSGYAVEEAIWGVLCGCWLVICSTVSVLDINTWILAPTSAFAILNLVLCSIFTKQSKDLEISLFQMTFGSWLAFTVSVLEILTVPKLTQTVQSPVWVSIPLLAVSMSLSTIQMLLSGAAASPQGWESKPRSVWADVYILLITSVHGCVLRLAFPVGFYCILAVNLLAVCVIGIKLGKPFRGVANMDLIFEILTFSLQMTSLMLSLGVAYASQTTYIFTAILSLPAIASISIRLANAITHVDEAVSKDGKSNDEQPSAPTQGQIEAAERRTQANDAAERGTQANGSAESSVRVNLMVPGQSSFEHLNSRIASDALLFGRTRALSSRIKKNI